MTLLQDQGLRLVLLSDLVARVEKGNVEDLITAGLTAEQLDRLRSLSHSELQRLAAARQSFVAVTLDTAALKTCLQGLAAQKDMERLRDYFIVNGASPAMMSKFFKLNGKATRKLRRALNVTRGPGYPALPSITVRERVHRAWADIETPDVRVRYLDLHRSFPELTLDALHLIVTEFENTR